MKLGRKKQFIESFDLIESIDRIDGDVVKKHSISSELAKKMVSRKSGGARSSQEDG
jgi:hypothetical protein